jgi:hypothetical protein
MKLTTRILALASAVVVACFGAAGVAQADSPPTVSSATNVKAVIVLIGANDYGIVANPPR